MITVERVLCPIDLTAEGGEALRYALALVKAYRAQLLLFYNQTAAEASNPASRERLQELFPLALLSRLDGDELKALNWTGIVSSRDDLGAAICTAAQNHNADLIVMRSRRRPHAAVLLGSTAETVCSTAPCPVLVTHPNETEFVGLSTEEIDLRRVLIPHDFSADSALALEYGCSLAQEYQAEVHFLHVLEPPTRIKPEPVWSVPARESAYILAAAKLQRAIPKQVSLWCRVTNALRRGTAHEEVLAYAREQVIDLICMGASQSTGRFSKFLGSTVDRVLRQAPCPVLVARPLERVCPERAIELEMAAT
jgi:nucleotide-binding universal stress UspA family protein